MSFFKRLGDTFFDLTSGITSNISGSGALKEANAAQILANAEITKQQLVYKENKEKREQTTLIVVLVLVFVLPLVALGIISKKT